MAGKAGTGGSTGTGGAATGGSTGTGGTAVTMKVITSASGAYWTTATATTVTSGTANVTVNDTSAAQKWDGFGGAFNELGWTYLTSSTMQTQAMTLLFSSTAGANFQWGRIPMGASDYATSRYTDDDTGTDVTPSSSNRPPADTSMAMFSLTRDGQNLIPYIQAAQGVNPNLRFWSSPWTPPVWMKTGYDSASGTKKPSYFDGGSYVTGNASYLTAYATYYSNFVKGYKAKGINIEVVSPQNEPGYEQNYPSCLWDKTTYVAWVKALGAVMQPLGVKIMLGTMSNNGDSSGGMVRHDTDIATAVLGDSAAAAYVSVAGAQWGVLDAVNGGTKFGSLPIWATEHKCGNYPWNPSGYPAYNSSQAPNDQAYGVESWGYIRDAITKGKVTAYNAWNMVLDKSGLGNDTTRDWKQDALLVAGSGSVTATPAYYVFRHLSQYVQPGATVVGTSGGDAVAFKNADGSVEVAMYNSGSASTYIVKIKGQMYSFPMPASGWATVVVP
jgi:glucosylceramidase